jgi:hypothetical protein
MELQRDRRAATLFVHRSFLSSAVYAPELARDALMDDAKRRLSELKRVRYDLASSAFSSSKSAYESEPMEQP